VPSAVLDRSDLGIPATSTVEIFISYAVYDQEVTEMVAPISQGLQTSARSTPDEVPRR